LNHKTLIQNFSYLSALQIFNMMLPLVTYPYLIRVLGKETYGLVVFAQAIVAYLTILVSFGFNVSATREISIHRDNPEKLSEIVSSVLIVKSLLLAIAVVLLGALLFILPQANGYKALFIVSLWACLYDVLFPVWYFQGIEQMKYITYLTLISRVIFLGLIFVWIRTSADYLYVPIISGIGAVISGLVALYLIFIKHRIPFRWQPVGTLTYYLKDSLPIFISNVSVNLYVSTNKVLTGAFLGMSEVAYYDLAEKLTTVLRMPQSILSQSLFPKVSKEKNVGFVKGIFKLSMAMNVLLFVAMVLLSKVAITLLGGSQMLPAQTVVIILAATVPVVAMSNIFGMQLLIPFGYNKLFSRVIVSSGLFYLLQLLVLWATIGFSINGISLVTLITELFVTAYMFYHCKKQHLWV
jgi:PST family polysaccharide transporter